MEKHTNIWIYLNLSNFPSCVLKDPNMRTPNFTKRPKIFIDTIHKLCKPNVDNVWFLFYRKYWNTISSIEIMNRLKILVLIDSLILKIVRLLEALLWGRNIFSPTNIQKEEEIAKLIEPTVLQFIPLFFQEGCALKKAKSWGMKMFGMI